jgi:spermidine synthase
LQPDPEPPRPRRAARLRRVLFAATLALAACLNLPAGERLVYLERSPGQTLIVTDSATRRCLRFGEGVEALNQSCKLLAQPDHLAFEYTRAMVAVLLLWEPQPRRVLLIGVGGGSIPTALATVRPASDIDAVDIDASVLAVAQRYFGLVPGPQLRLHAADGREFVTAALARGDVYDAVLLDAFDAEGIPPALFSEAFLRDIRALLTPNGVFLANTFAASASYAQETAAARQAFGRIHSVRLNDTGGNRLIVAAKSVAQLRSPAQLLAELPAREEPLARLGIDAAWVRQLRYSDGD